MKRLKLRHQFIMVFLISLLLILFLVYKFVIPRSIEPYNQSVFYILRNKLQDNDYENLENNFAFIQYKNGEVINQSANLFHFISNKTINEIVLYIQNNDNKTEGVIQTTSGKVYFVYELDNQDTFNIFLSSSKSRKNEILGLPDKTVVVILITFLIPVTFIMIWFTKISKSIKSLKQLVEKPNHDKQDMYIAASEIKDLYDAIVQYQIDIKENELKKQELFQNISHNLKTPITTIKMYAEGIEDEIYYENDLKKSAAIILEESELLTRKVNQIMHLNKVAYLNESHIDKAFDQISLDTIFQNTIRLYEKRAKRINFTFTSDMSLFTGQFDLWQLIIDNIFDNSIRYAKSTISITILNQSIVISNDGNSIDPNIIHNLFEPYTKGEGGNYGLGLHIIKKTLGLFHYNITIKNTDDGVSYLICK